MKKVEIKETVSKYVWEAIDGTQFSNEAECKKYDNSAEAVLLANYNSLIINSFDEETLFNCGSCDYIIDIIKISSKEQINMIMQLVCLFNPYIAQDPMRYVHFEAICLKAIKNDDYLFIGRGYERKEGFWILDIMMDRLNHILKKCDSGSLVEIKDDPDYLDEE